MSRYQHLGQVLYLGQSSITLTTIEQLEMQLGAIFIPDISPKIGLGHFYRCLRLAKHLKQRHWKCCFLAKSIPAQLLQTLRQNRIDFKSLDVTPNQIAKFLKTSTKNTAWVITDNYTLDLKWELGLKKACSVNIAAFDDDDGRKHACDLIFRTNELDSSKSQKLNSTTTKFLLGPRYYVTDFVPFKKPAPSKIKNILFFLGATVDPLIFEKLLQSIYKAIEHSDLRIFAIEPKGSNLVLGKDLRSKVKLISDYTLLQKLLIRSDLYVGSGGTITFDRLLFAIPAISISMASNQNKLNVVLDKIGSQIYLGQLQKNTARLLELTLRKLLSNPKRFIQLQKSSKGIVDFHGGERIEAYLRYMPIELRRAELHDRVRMLKWRNHLRVRKASLETKKISIKQHNAWFNRKLRDQNCDLLIAHSRRVSFGVLRFDRTSKNSVLISIFLSPQIIGLGLGSELLRAGTRWIRENRPEVKRLNAIIRPENLASIKSFTAAGYKKTPKYFVLNLKK